MEKWTLKDGEKQATFVFPYPQLCFILQACRYAGASRGASPGHTVFVLPFAEQTGEKLACEGATHIVVDNSNEAGGSAELNTKRLAQIVSPTATYVCQNMGNLHFPFTNFSRSVLNFPFNSSIAATALELAKGRKHSRTGDASPLFLIGYPRPHKVYIAALLEVRGTLHLFRWASFACPDQYKNGGYQTLLAKYGYSDTGALDAIPRIVSQLPRFLDQRDSACGMRHVSPQACDLGQNDILGQAHAAAVFALVAESEMFGSLTREGKKLGNSRLRITEKVIKCFASRLPFITFAPVASLAYLRDIGFKTFSPHIDESYDKATEAWKRSELVADEASRLATLKQSILSLSL